jgi:hypothetical protein
LSRTGRTTLHVETDPASLEHRCLIDARSRRAIEGAKPLRVVLPHDVGGASSYRLLPPVEEIRAGDEDASGREYHAAEA